IAAIVNRQVITLKQVNDQVAIAQRNLKAQNIPVPKHSILQRQVLQRMILEELQHQEADRLGIQVSDSQLQRAVQTIAQRNRLSVEQLRRNIEKSGVPWEVYLNELRSDVRFDMLRQRAVDS